MLKKCKTWLLLCLAICLLFVVACSSNEGETPTDTPSSTSSLTPVEASAPWNNGGKQPVEYTYDEFVNLPKDQQIAFQKSFKDMGEFDKWLQKSQQSELVIPWENGGKQPSEYTFEEFNKLSPGLQIAFQNSFESIDKFDEWMQQSQQVEIELPWEKEGAKQPKDYTKKEFEALTPGQQIAFQKTFASAEEFMNWLQSK